jgi:arylsulfatase A-like enzyme
VWFHSPHADVVAGPEYLKQYPDRGEAAHYYGCVTELDDQVGRLHKTLKSLSLFENTLIFFCSDNGPEGRRVTGRFAGTTGGFRGRKRALYEGGIRVPAFAVWPAKIEPGSTSDAICSTLDYFPTIAQVIGFEMPDDRPLDGQDILPILQGNSDRREVPLAFRFNGGTAAWVEAQYKLLVPSGELYNLEDDPQEQRNLAADEPERAQRMLAKLETFFEDVARSHSGGDYDDPDFRPTNRWRPLVTVKRSSAK